MTTAIVLRGHFEIEVVGGSIDIPIFDTGVGEMHLLVEVWQVILAGPLFDLFPASIGTAVAVRIVPIPLLEEALVVAFQLAVESDALDGRCAVLKLGSLAEKGTINLHIVRPLSRSVRTRIEVLSTVAVSGTVALQEAATAVCQCERTFPIANRYAFD